MTGGAPRRWLEVGGWLLTPVVAWAVAFLGGWVGAILGGRLESSVSGIALILGGAVLGAIVGAFGWARLLRRRFRVPGVTTSPLPRTSPVADQPRQETWDRYWGEKPEVGDVYPAVSDLLGEIGRVLPDVRGRRVLEVGAGTGREGHTLATRGAMVVALDFSPEALRLSRQISRAVRFVRGDALHAPFRDDSFDLVYHQGLLEHFRNPHPLLVENRRLTKPGGMVLIDVPQTFHVYTLVKKLMIALNRWFAGWETQYSPGALRRLVERAGFRCIRRYGYGMHPGFTYRVLREVMRPLGVRLPLEPALGPLQGAYAAWHRLLRRVEASPVGPYVTVTVGVVARKDG